MNILHQYHLPQREALTVTLYEEGLIEIKQSSPHGTEETSPPVMLDTHDLGDLMNMLDSARLAWMRRHEQPQELPAKKKEPPAAD